MITSEIERNHTTGLAVQNTPYGYFVRFNARSGSVDATVHAPDRHLKFWRLCMATCTGNASEMQGKCFDGPSKDSIFTALRHYKLLLELPGESCKAMSIPLAFGLFEAAPNAGVTRSAIASGYERQVTGQIDMLRKRLEASKPLTDQYMSTLDLLLQSVTDEVMHFLQSGRMPVYKATGKSGLIVTISHSTYAPGHYQVTRWNSTGALGDSQYHKVRTLVSSEGLATGYNLLDTEQAIIEMNAVCEAEAIYQESRRALHRISAS